MNGFKINFDTFAEFEFFLQIFPFGDCVALSQPLLSVPFYSLNEKRNLRQESFAEFYDYIQLQPAHIAKLMADGADNIEAFHGANRRMEDAFLRLCSTRSLTKESAAYAAKQLASRMSHDDLVELVAKYSEFLFTRLERVIGLRKQWEPATLGLSTSQETQPNELVQQLNQYKRALINEFHALVYSPSWQLTVPLRTATRLLSYGSKAISFKKSISQSSQNEKWTSAQKSLSSYFPATSILYDEIASLEKEIEAIQQSPCWLITRPLRKLMGSMGDVRIKCPDRISAWMQSHRESGVNVMADLVVFDDAFPVKLSAFRFAEYTELLKTFPNCHVVTNASSEGFISKSRSISELLDEYAKEFPELAKRVHRSPQVVELKAKLAYCVFLSLVHHYLPIFESQNIPFVFTLYPGGLFELNQPNSDAMLKRVFSSPQFRKVIVTQRIVKDYLLANRFCKAEQVAEIIGCVTLDNSSNSKTKRYFGREKSTKDICMVAHKYHARGLDKGYDVFIEVAKELSVRMPDAYFHVVGGFTASDISVCGIEGRIRFYGTLEVEELQDFFLSMDAIVSPNVHGVHSPGQFDGFPTACCIEAGLNGVVPFCTDFLKQNTVLEEGKDIILIDRNVCSIANILEDKLSDMDNFYQTSRRVKQTFSRVFGYEGQIQPRIDVLKEQLSQFEVVPCAQAPVSSR
ncbi:MAG: glycosyltransferase family 4 protein [Candidatus Melainabacteria bacterium]|nr:glycosyltransferase family 4 protein [Candidatus Melainabacteria bacterium]